jgi:cell division protein FtsB
MFRNASSKLSEPPVSLRLRTYLPMVGIVLCMAFFTAHALTGQHGLLLASQRRSVLAAKEAKLGLLRKQRQALEIRARLLRFENLSRDLVEERAHEVLGFVRPGDYVIRETPGRG